MTTHKKNSLALLIAGPHPGENAMHNDQTVIAQALFTRGIPADHILSLHGRLDRHLVLAALESLRRRMAGWEQGSLFVHVSGHGYVVGESGDSARAGLLFAGTEDVNDAHHLLWEEFFAALAVPDGVRLTLLPDL